MTLAELCLAQVGNSLSTRKAAKKVQPDFSFARDIDHMEEGIIIYSFCDGSQLATNNNRRDFQRWIVS
jgi:hypothetical protein